MKKSVLSLFAILLIGSTANAQRWSELEISTGVYSVLGEMQDVNLGMNALNSSTLISYYTRAHKSDRWAFGGSVGFNTMNMQYDGTKNWLNGHETQGYGVNAMLGARLVLSGRDDMRFMKGAFITYLEAAGGGHLASFRSSYPPMVSSPKEETADSPRQMEFAPVGTATLGFQYYITYKIGVNLRLSGTLSNTDYLDGIQGITDAKDYAVAALAGVSIAL